jgi:(S)-3,5-dihydroxyphenylglycine transaminase
MRKARSIQLNARLYEASLDAMNVLNEVVSTYEHAISFAPGRPLDSTLFVAENLEKISRYIDYVTSRSGISRKQCFDRLGQYGNTNGLIRELIAHHLERDENIRARPETIMVTSGCQEAMAVLLMGLFEPGKDVLLVSDPTYVGITGMAQILGVSIAPVACTEHGLDLDELRAVLAQLRAQNQRPRAFYHIPDFNNPLGTSMPVADRYELIELAAKEEILLFEDNPYGMFDYDGDAMPTLKSLDEEGVVIYLGTFSKTLFPGLRVGYMVADQLLDDLRPCAVPAPRRRSIAEELSKVKSFLSVNTSPLSQAIVGGVLLENDGSLRHVVREKIGQYQRRRDHMLGCLEANFGGHRDSATAIRWSRPRGGFFLTVELPFAFDEHDMRRCAEQYGVIVCPMSLFSIVNRLANQIRLSFSYVSESEISAGVAKLARYVADRIEGKMAADPGVAPRQEAAWVAP